MDNCKNDQKSTFNHNNKLWKEGQLVAWWNGKPIHPDDEETFQRYQRHELERLRSPVLLAAMVDMVKRWGQKKIAVIFHITGVPEATRFFKQRMNHINTIPSGKVSVSRTKIHRSHSLYHKYWNSFK